ISSEDESTSLVLKEMREAIQRADSITRGLLDFSASRQLAIKPEDLNTAMEETLRLVRHELTRNGVALETELGSELPKVPMDKNQIQQVLVNVFMNAIQA